MSLQEDIAPDQLKVELSKTGRSQAGLARHLGVDTSAVNRMVNGKRQIKARELSKIREYLEETAKAWDSKTRRSMRIKHDAVKRIIKTGVTAIDGSMRELILEVWSQVFKELRTNLRGVVHIKPEESADAFWQLTIPNAEVLILMGLGGGIVSPEIAPNLRALATLADIAIDSTDADFDGAPAVNDGLRSYLGIRDPDSDLTGKTLRQRIAMQSAGYSMMLSGDQEELKRALQEFIEFLDPPNA